MRIMILFSVLLVVLGGQLKAAEPQPAELGLSQLPLEIHLRIMTHIVRDEHPKRALSSINGLYCTDTFLRDHVSHELESIIRKVYDAPRAVALLYGGIKKNRAEFFKCAQEQDNQEYEEALNAAFRWYDGSDITKKVCTQLIVSRLDAKKYFASQRPEYGQKVMGEYYISPMIYSEYSINLYVLRSSFQEVALLYGAPISGLGVSLTGTECVVLYRGPSNGGGLWTLVSCPPGGNITPKILASIPQLPVEFNLVRYSFDREGNPLIYYTYNNQDNELYMGLTTRAIKRPEDLPAWKVADYRIMPPEQQ